MYYKNMRKQNYYKQKAAKKRLCNNCGVYGTRTHDLRRDRAAF